MNIEKNRVVQFHYTLHDENDALLEDSRKGEAMAYLHGAGNIFPGMESALAGKQAGDTVDLTLAPEDAYGLRREDAIRRVSRKHILAKGRLTPGMVVNIDTDQGRRQVLVIKVGKFVVDIDTNHPLAGRTLRFNIEVMDVRQASEEELAHGHAHGAGGHQH